jgi:hypothetical protein
MTVISEDQIHRRCTMAALVAAALHLLAIAGDAYQISARHPSAEHAFIYFGQFFYWGPAVLLLLMRKFCVLVGSVAVPRDPVRAATAPRDGILAHRHQFDGRAEGRRIGLFRDAVSLAAGAVALPLARNPADLAADRHSEGLEKG